MKRQSGSPTYRWLYTWNPLEGTPLVSIDKQYPDRVICPVPRFLARRVTNGVFYDLVEPRVSRTLRGSFQAYIGEVIRKSCPAPRFTSFRIRFTGRKDQKHGADWILSDDTGTCS